ncbi:MAG: acetyltransferase component of pyruvate dehydrogenase complex [marine bacterium B5-7]|nr:MAG: acetyltransferase component of pyruvate dehydrogenase complex [marine bacterium B5-7]
MPDTIEIKVPDIGDFDNVEIIEILVSSGDTVKAEDPLITLESDKATMDVPSPADGTIDEVTVKVGDKVSEGSLVARMKPGEDSSDADPSGGDDGDEDRKPNDVSSNDDSSRTDETGEDKAQVDDADKDEDKGSSEDKPATDDASRLKSGDDGNRDISRSSRRSPPTSLPPPVERAGGALPHASPGIRRFARELGADLNQIRGSGAKGRILKSDIKEYIKARLSEPATQHGTVEGVGIPQMPEVDFSKFGEVEVTDLSRIKKISGAHLHRAWLNIPHVTHNDESDITDLEAFRKEINEELARRKSSTKITLLAFAMKALSTALKEFPNFNSSLTPDGQRLVYKKYFHIGIAVDTPGGLVVPVFRDVDSKGILELADEMSEVSARARDGKLKPGEMQGGSMSISSLGGIGGTSFTPIVNAPEVAILGLTRSRMIPVYNGKKFVPRLILPISLSYDHRVIDGAEAARFTAYLCQALKDPRRLLL